MTRYSVHVFILQGNGNMTNGVVCLMNTTNGQETRDLNQNIPSLAENNQLQVTLPQQYSPHINAWDIPEQYIEFLKTPMTIKQLKKMANQINTAWKVKSLALELGMDLSRIDAHLENNRNIVEASFEFLREWYYQIVDSEKAWKDILHALHDAKVFPSVQYLEGFCNLELFDINPTNNDEESSEQSAPSS